MSDLYKCYTQLRQNNPLTIEIYRIENCKKCDLLLVFDDRDVVRYLDKNIGNYYSWMAIKIKSYIKEVHQLKGTVSCIYYSNYYSNSHKETNLKIKKASIVIDCNSNLDLDAPLYQF
jgi:hypothetical protein